jgi:quinol monooxygenase YgiN
LDSTTTIKFTCLAPPQIPIPHIIIIRSVSPARLVPQSDVMSSTIPLLLITTPLPPEVLPTCRKLIESSRSDWLFLTSSTTLILFQLNTHGNPVTQTELLVAETFPVMTERMLVEPTLGFIQRAGQTVPMNAVTTIVKYRCSDGDRGKVIDSCRGLFEFAEKEELDVFTLAIMINVEDEDSFVILERYKDAEAERTHLASPRCVEVLKEIKGMIVSHDSRSFDILDV